MLVKDITPENSPYKNEPKYCPRCKAPQSKDFWLTGDYTCGLERDEAGNAIECEYRQKEMLEVRVNRLENALREVINIRNTAQGARQFVALDAIEQVATKALTKGSNADS